MKFTISVEIDLPIHKVFQLFADKDNLKEWQKELIRYEHVSGKPGEVGAVTKLVYKSVTIIETIAEKNTPHEFDGTYEHKRGVHTVMVHKAFNSFIEQKKNKTLYEMKIVYVKFAGIIPKLMGVFMGFFVRKYYQNWLNQFKSFAEKKNTSQEVYD